MSEDCRLSLAGKEIVFTGRLAALSRAAADAVVVAREGRCARTVTRQTDVLVVGQERLPLTRSGAVNANLKRGRAFRSRFGSPMILTEEEFFDRLGLVNEASGVRRRYGSPELCRALGVTPVQLRAWTSEGLIFPADVEGVVCFDFRQTAAIRTLVSLARSGVTMARLRRNLQLLRRCLPEIEHPLEQLALLERDGRMLFRLEEGVLADSGGQMQLDFQDDADGPTSGKISQPSSALSASQNWELGSEHEAAGRLAQAEAAYRQALRMGGPKAELCFNLANVLTVQGQLAASVERYYQAIELDRRFAEAWNNLGNVLVEMKNLEDAVAAYRETLVIDPNYGDVHYNLADALEQLGKSDEAQYHWQTFLAKESQGPWADHARQRLAQ
jgi:tetratricopeptide (TPR) repeat protein